MAKETHIVNGILFEFDPTPGTFSSEKTAYYECRASYQAAPIQNLKGAIFYGKKIRKVWGDGRKFYIAFDGFLDQFSSNRFF